MAKISSQIYNKQTSSTESVANALSKNQRVKKDTFQLVDNRPKAVIQQKLVDAMEKAPIKGIIQKKVNNTGLPDHLKSGIESLSGYAMDDVKVHYNSDKPAQLNAHAYAQGTDIHIASGQEKHLPHEAWHVVQQKQGRVKPTMQLKDKVNINDDDTLEKEADEMGTKALQKKKNSNNQSLKGSKNVHNTTVQRFLEPKGLDDLENRLQTVVADYKAAHIKGISDDEPLYGSEQWGRDTYWAANRKLDEWGLVKHLLESGLGLKDAADIGFGINDTEEPDGLVRNEQGGYISAGENKWVTGKFSQVRENINSALSQLTNGNRAKLYQGTDLVALINIDPESEAFTHLHTMIRTKESVFKGMQTRWRNRLLEASAEGNENWTAPSSLRLIIRANHQVFFNEAVEAKAATASAATGGAASAAASGAGAPQYNLGGS